MGKKMVALVCALITGLVLLIYGLYLMIFKGVVTNKDIIIFLFFGFAYVGYTLQVLKDKIARR